MRRSKKTFKSEEVDLVCGLASQHKMTVVPFVVEFSPAHLPEIGLECIAQRAKGSKQLLLFAAKRFGIMINSLLG